MDEFVLQDGKIYVFKNQDATEKNQQPQYKGKLKTPTGEELEVSLWVSNGKNGKYFSGQIQEPYKKEETQPTEKDEVADDLPF